MEKRGGNIFEFDSFFSKSQENKSSIEQTKDYNVALGRFEAERKNEMVTISDEARARHLMLIGASGTGKSTLMMNIIDQIIYRKTNESLFVLDPHGDMYQEACQRYYKKSVDNFMSIDFSTKDHGFQFNPLACDSKDRWFMVSRIINDFLELFEHTYNMNRAGGPMFELYMRNALLLLLNDEEVHTLSDVAKLFNNARFRKDILSRCTQLEALEFWKNAITASGEVSLENISAYVSSKLVAFTTNPLIGRIFNTEKCNFNFNALFQKPTIVFFSLHKGILSNRDVHLLGTMLLHRLNLTALNSHRSGGTSVRCNVLLDEAHNFLTPTMVQMFPEARKFGINMLIAIQNLQQLESTVDTLLGNVGNLIAFRLGVNDSHSIGEYFVAHGGHTELLDLPNFVALTRILTSRGIDSSKRVSVRPTKQHSGQFR